jgi:hypothetical protein
VQRLVFITALIPGDLDGERERLRASPSVVALSTHGSSSSEWPGSTRLI